MAAKICNKMMRVRHLMFLGFLLVTGCVSTPPPIQGELGKLQGQWQLVYQELDGDEVPNPEAARMFHGRMVFTGDKVVYAADLPGFYFEFKCRIDATKEPRAIDFETLREGYEHSRQSDKDIGRKFFGIYRLSGDELLICWNDQRRPEKFSGMAGTGNTLVVLKRK